MIQIRRILCPVDLSECSRHALSHALAIARWYESSVTLLHVMPRVAAGTHVSAVEGFPPVAITPATNDEVLTAVRQFAEEHRDLHPADAQRVIHKAFAILFARARLFHLRL